MGGQRGRGCLCLFWDVLVQGCWSIGAEGGGWRYLSGRCSPSVRMRRTRERYWCSGCVDSGGGREAGMLVLAGVGVVSATVAIAVVGVKDMAVMFWCAIVGMGIDVCVFCLFLKA